MWQICRELISRYNKIPRWWKKRKIESSKGEKESFISRIYTLCDYQRADQYLLKGAYVQISRERVN